MSEIPSIMSPHPQQTIQQIVDLRGKGLFTSQNVRIRFLPAEAGTGICFQRIDLEGRPVVQAHVNQLVSEARHTVLVDHGARLETVEHVLAALAGLGIDNCLVQLNSSEPPNCDGSSFEFVKLLESAGIISLDSPRRIFTPLQTIRVEQPPHAFIELAPPPVISTTTHYLRIDYHLDYGPASSIPAQSVIYSHSRDNFVSELAPARTFIEEHEIEKLRAFGYGKLTTNRDLLVFNRIGVVIGNTLRHPWECARHKILDFLGDIVLSGVTISGHIKAHMSGHALNHQLAKKICEQSQKQFIEAESLVLN